MALPFFNKDEVIGTDAPDAFYIGRYFNRATRRALAKIQIGGNEPIIIIGRNRSGKDIGIGLYNALRLQGRSIFWVDPRCEAFAVCAPYRRTLGPTWGINPDSLHTEIYPDLKSSKRNPLLGPPWNAELFDEASAIAEAWIQIEGTQPHFERRARGNLVLPAILWEIRQAAIEGRPPSVLNIRRLLTEPDEFDPQTGRQIRGLAVTARRMAAEGGLQIASLISTFTGKPSEETAGSLSTFDGQSQWMLSSLAAADMDTAGGVDLRELGQRPCSCFLVVPQPKLQTYAPMMRETISSALRALYKPSKTVCTFWLNEFATLGKMESIESALGMVAGCGIQLVFVVQSLTQLKLHYGDAWENFMSQACAWVVVGPVASKFDAEYLSARSGEMTVKQPTVGSNINPGGGMGQNSGWGYMRRPWLMPDDFYAIEPGFGYVFATGLSGAIPAYFPPYLDVAQLNARARVNPDYV